MFSSASRSFAYCSAFTRLFCLHNTHLQLPITDLGEHDGQFGHIGSDVEGVAELGDEGDGGVGRPGQEVGDDDGHGDLGRLDLRFLLGLALADLGVQLLGHLAHLLLVLGYGAVDEEVAEQDDAQGDREATDVQAHDVRPGGENINIMPVVCLRLSVCPTTISLKFCVMTPSPDLEPTGEEKKRAASQQLEARH